MEANFCCELLQNVYLCISTYNLKVIFTCITASNKTFVQIKNAKQKEGVSKCPHPLFLCTKPRLSQARALLFPKVFVPLGIQKFSL